VAQQLLALSLQERGVGEVTWPEWLGEPFVLGADAAARIPAITAHLLDTGFLAADGGILGIGSEAERSLGRQHFMELLSVFTSPPMFSVRHGRTEIGLVPDEALTARPAGYSAGGAHALILAGRSWEVRHVDWPRRIVQVEPADTPGVTRWRGGGQPLGAEVARGVREVLAGVELPGVSLSKRATEQLADLRALHPWADPGATTVVHDEQGRARWWTFAGRKANLALARIAEPFRTEVAAVEDLWVALDPGTELAPLAAAVRDAPPEDVDLAPWVAEEAVDGLEFSECLPRDLAVQVITARLADPASVTQARNERMANWKAAQA
jgi:ATP-dependent Lhr-like helicase